MTCDAVWPRLRLFNAGYVAFPTCQLCNAAEDTIHHRAWWCSAACATAARAEHASEALVCRAHAVGPAGPIFNYGLVPLVEARVPAPASDFAAQSFRPDGSSMPISQLMLRGTGCIHGSASQHAIPEFRRAAWAAVEVGEDGELGHALLGVVPKELPQTSKAAEYVAAEPFCKCASDGASPVGECANVMTHVGLEETDALSGKRRYAGVLRTMRGARRGPLHMRKVKAHQSLNPASPPAEQALAFGNAAADLGAKVALVIHG